MDNASEPQDQPATQEEVEARRRRAYLAMTPDERLALSFELQAQAMAVLRESPAGRAAFVRRNHHQCRAEFVNGQWVPLDP
jgi:hypothetical protein